MVVAKLQAPKEAPEGIARNCRNRVRHAAACVSTAVAQVSTDIKSGPIQKRYRSQALGWSAYRIIRGTCGAYPGKHHDGACSEITCPIDPNPHFAPEYY